MSERNDSPPSSWYDPQVGSNCPRCAGTEAKTLLSQRCADTLYDAGLAGRAIKELLGEAEDFFDDAEAQVRWTVYGEGGRLCNEHRVSDE